MVMLGAVVLAAAFISSIHAKQRVLHSDTSSLSFVLEENSYLYPRVQYPSDLLIEAPPPEMTLYSIHQSDRTESYDLAFFSDGYTREEEEKFILDVKSLSDDIVSETGAMYHVAHLLNIWAVFTPSNMSGIGTHDHPIPGAPFGLYRPGDELRGVYVAHHGYARAACAYWRSNEMGGCDQPIILGNDPLYGGLGGEFTVITSSKLNGPIVLRHELGHSLIDVGEEYEGGYVYSGVNADEVAHLHDLKWKEYLTEPSQVRIEDAKVPLQEYPWYNLTKGPYNVTFTSNNPSASGAGSKTYPTGMIRLSLSSIPYPNHIIFVLNDIPLNLSTAFLQDWKGSHDRRWLELALPHGLPFGQNTLEVYLSDAGKKANEGQGGKMLTSVEIIEYGGHGRFNDTLGFIGAFPTYDLNGRMTLRPTNEECLMRKVNAEKFCPVCRDGLEVALLRKIKAKRHQPR